MRGYIRTSIPPTDSGNRVAGAVGSVLNEWTERSHGKLSFHLTRYLSDMDVFGAYLEKIGRERTAQCHHCTEERNTAQHTLEHCPAWANERRVLQNTIGEDLSFSTVTLKMVESEEN
ncbi:uncharacterized protein [Anoplolepis gracilipes]|uniref:uncharacterized protein n=1 Tax=Anoplolepis gracilipes TaxID=354296 RepID=UPI003B9DDC2F